MNYLTSNDVACFLAIYVQPGAKKNQLAGEFDGQLKMRLQAPPVEGLANAALVAWWAKSLGLPKRDVVLLSGEKSRHKRLQLPLSAKAKLIFFIQQHVEP
ncbi:MAG: DUF167 domain-containing protein [Neisseriaceae bacterium]|nr:DUF167 domain-containing protein [Neisseriaceae bacterium]